MVDEDAKYITDLKDSICANFLSLRKDKKIEADFAENISDFVFGIQLGGWLERPYYSKFSKDLASLLVGLLNNCSKLPYVVENKLDDNFKLKIHFENFQDGYKEIVIDWNYCFNAKDWPSRMEKLLDPNNKSIDLCKLFNYIEPSRIKEIFWSIYEMQECNPYILSFVKRLDYGANFQIDASLEYSPTYNKTLSLDDFISKWCSESENTLTNDGISERSIENIFDMRIPVKDMEEYFSILTVERNSKGETFLSKSQLTDFINKACAGETGIPKIYINFNPNKEKRKIRSFFWQFYFHCIDSYKVSPSERKKFAELLCDNFNNFELGVTLTNFSKRKNDDMSNPLKK